MLVEVISKNIKDFYDIICLLYDYEVGFESRQYGEDIISIICTGGFGKNGNSRKSVIELLKEAECVKNISAINVGYKLSARLNSEQLTPIFVRDPCLG